MFLFFLFYHLVEILIEVLWFLLVVGWLVVVVVVVLTSIYAVAGRVSVNNNKRKGTWVTHL